MLSNIFRWPLALFALLFFCSHIYLPQSETTLLHYIEDVNPISSRLLIEESLPVSNQAAAGQGEHEAYQAITLYKLNIG